MQFSKIVAILSFTAGTTLATPQYTHELSKRTCWELTGTALKICQEACTLACEAATAGLAKSACATACDATELKAREIEAREVPQIEARATTENTTTTIQVTDISAVVFPKVDTSVGREACVIACEVTCNSTVLALIQSACLSECKSLCPSS